MKNTTVALSALDLLDRRLAELTELIGSIDRADRRDRFVVLAETVEARLAQLRQSPDLGAETGDPDDPHGTLYSLFRVVDELRHDVDAELADEESPAEVAERRIRGWIGALEDLRVQAKLGRMELDDEIDALATRGRAAWDHIVHDVQRASADAAHEIDAATGDIQLLMAELRESAGKLIRAGGGA